MLGLGDTVSNLMKLRQAAQPGASHRSSDLLAVQPTGSNPGNLGMYAFVPPGLPPRAPLVVALHGCTQTAAGYDAGAGWSTLARRHGFALLLPQQVSANNANTCFNWFEPKDTTRGSGEALSIAEMIKQMVRVHGLDPARVYVTGLSAGGAMTAVMLATYPELFAGGAIIAGLPYGAAAGLPAALEAMRHLRGREAAEWGELVRRASPPGGRRPSIQLWHGEADTTVRSQALEEAIKQWANVLELESAPVIDRVDGAAHRAWTGVDGRVVLESYLVPGMGHGVPLRTTATDVDESVGAAEPFMLEAGISSTWRIARAWGLLTQAARQRDPASPTHAATAALDPGAKVAATIRDALRATGLRF